MGRRASWFSLVGPLATAGVLFLVALTAYRDLLGRSREWLPADYRFHLQLAQELSADPLPVPHPLFHYAVARVLSRPPERGWAAAQRSAALVLALAVALRGWLTYRELSPPLAAPEAVVACLALALAMALPKWWDFPNLLQGQVNANVWHNPTTVFAAPLAVVTFLAGLRYWDAPGPGRALAVGLWSALCALAKPNYLLAFFPCFGPILVALVARAAWRGQLSAFGAFLHLVAAFGPPLGVLLLQFVYAFGGEAKVVFAPLKVWGVYSQNIPASVLAGVAFPCAVAACFPRPLARDRRTLLAWGVLAVAAAQYALLAEAPEGRMVCGNFAWGLVPAAYILFMESCRLAGRQPAGGRVAVCCSVLALHAASGTFYLVRSIMVPADCPRF
jgi:hypothetical protein